MKKYLVRPIPSPEIDDALGAYPTMLRKLLSARGITTAEQAQMFFSPDYDAHTHDPFLLKDMEKVVERILKAVRDKEKIVIYSDYDADGVPGAVVLHDFFKKIGFTNFENYIPHRHDEGFGLNIDAVEGFAAKGVNLVITIDCGIADVAEVARAKELGICLIVTDHHLPGEIIPDAYAIINPKQSDCEYPEKMLCGSGVIFKVVQALVKRGREQGMFVIIEGWEKWLLDMVGVATLSDMVPLVGENRVFGHYGLKVLRKSPRIGLLKLFSRAKVNQRFISEDDIGFTLSPRINAASRMGAPMTAFTLLSTPDENQATLLAEELEAINNERKGIVASMAKDAKRKAAERYGAVEGPKVVVLGNPEWKPSLLGLVANSIAEDFHCPVFLWGRDGEGVLKGSCRSDGVTDLVNLMRNAAEETFLQFGGHAFSGGFTVLQEKIHLLDEALNESMKKISANATALQIQDFVDETLMIDDIDWSLYDQVASLAPFGVGNPKPVFQFQGVVPQNVKVFGKEGNHLELQFVNKKGKKLTAISFFTTPDDFGFPITVGQPITLIASLEKSTFRNFPELRLRIQDIVSPV